MESHFRNTFRALCIGDISSRSRTHASSKDFRPIQFVFSLAVVEFHPMSRRRRCIGVAARFYVRRTAIAEVNSRGCSSSVHVRDR
jgi:hypothetical protein